MSESGEPQTAGWYEVLVAGPVGAVLRCALEPCNAEPVQPRTIVVTRPHADVDLVDVTGRLLAHGSTISDIAVLEERATRERT